MAQLTVIESTHTAPADATHAAANASGDYAIIKHPERTFLSVKNAHTVSINVTIAGQVLSNQGKENDNTVTIPALTGHKLIPVRNWEIDKTGRVDITYSAVTSLTVVVVQIGI